MTTHRQRPLRADAERTVRTILEAAERVLSADPAATMEQIAEAAGVARTTVHRRFTTRDALIEALTAWATAQFAAAVDAAAAGTAPPLVALYQVTADVLRVKIGWGFAMARAATAADPEIARVHGEVLGACDALFRRARDAGVVRPDVDLDWARRVYYALIHEVAGDDRGDADIDALTGRIIETLLQGVGARADGPAPAAGR
ncbi:MULTISPECIES: TetR/AcrR family transcriptional regulator [Thermomonosporaceae]|uniref:TetR/AcrR family transcriptional regulator n=1 Tax=Thermomonosporaceae TaxID=2012 RepID=UPI00255B2050|nr:MULTISPECIES: TetR/AcrR family transcriptional regulator [Thermomonosporaceae]MDL4773708.1 helix-turn-helix domain-containing protein [Actinomadura xylanilytica]